MIDDDERRYRIRPKHTVRIVLGLFLVGLALGGMLVGMGAASAGSSLEEDATETPPATAPASPTAATSPQGTSHAGMDMDMGAATTAVAADAPAEPANRATPYGTTPLKYTMDGGVKVFRLTAAPVKWRVDDTHTMDAWAYNGQVPGPVIRATVGDRVRIVVTNHLPEPTTIHWHGVALPISQDGVPGISQKPIEPGKSFTYEFDLKAPGLAMYHPHFNTLAQQTKGLYGVLIVDPAEAPDPDVVEAFQVLSEGGGQFLINGKSFPSTDAYPVKVGQKVRVHVVNLGEMDHPMHLHGFLFTVVAQDGGAIPESARHPVYTQNVAPGESFTIEFTPDSPGTWLFHCHILGHVTGPNGTDAGMITAFAVK
jgi:FtsP/CotA-like multicopper oxidase with cupredoxin domain